MDSIQFLNLRKQLKEGQSLVLDFNGVVKITEVNNEGKRQNKIMGKLEEFPETIVPLQSKLWATPPNMPGKKSFYKFGDPLPKRDNNEIDVKILIGIVMTFKNSAKKSVWTDTQAAISYTVIESCGVKVYFFRDTPRFVEFNGKRTYINEKLPELKIEIFENIENVK